MARFGPSDFSITFFKCFSLFCSNAFLDRFWPPLGRLLPPLALKKPIPQLVGFVKHFVKMLGKSEGSDIQDPAARTRHPGYKRMPLNSVHELVHLQKKVRRSLKLIEAPALIAHGRLDRTASPADAMRIYRGLASKEKEILYLEASGHVVSVDWDGPELARKATDFFERLRG